MDTQVARKIERILALGYSEALRRRRSNPAKLDALTETTAAVCDLFAPAVADGSFYVSHVDVLHEGTSASSTLADFDSDIAHQLPPRGSLELHQGWKLVLPEHVQAQAGQQLDAFWNEVIDKFGLSRINFQAASVRSIHPNVADEFHASLRYAFDAVVEEDADNSFTLRVHPVGERYHLTTEHATSCALGYCLPNSRLDTVSSRLEQAPIVFSSDFTDIPRLSLLETLLRPFDKEEVFRSQSHTNVRTRTSGLVLGQKARSASLGKPLNYAGPGDRPIAEEEFAALEKAAWDVVPTTLFMMPLTNADFIESDATPQTLAHWYRVVEPHAPDVLALLARRYRASLLFWEVLYQRYCRAVASKLATGILDNLGLEMLRTQLGWIASAYGVADAYRVTIRPAESEAASLLGRLRRLRECGAVREGGGWGPQCEALLRARELEIKPLSSTHENHENDVLLGLARRLDFDLGQRVTPIRLARETLEGELDNLQKHLQGAREIETKVRSMLGYPEAPTERVEGLSGLFSSNDGWECLKSAPVVQASNDVWCSDGHGSGHLNNREPCEGGHCPDEQKRRMRLLFNWRAKEATGRLTTPDSMMSRSPKDEAALLAFERFLEAAPDTAWEWVKRSCSLGSSTKDRPSLACLVSLLFAMHAQVNWTEVLSRKWRSRLVGPPERWPVGLSAIAHLSINENDAHDRGTVAITAFEATEVTFRIQIGYAGDEWLRRVVTDAETTDVRRGHTAAKHFAAAYLCTSGRLPERDTEGFLNRVRLVVEKGCIDCTWKLSAK